MFVRQHLISNILLNIYWTSSTINRKQSHWLPCQISLNKNLHATVFLFDSQEMQAVQFYFSVRRNVLVSHTRPLSTFAIGIAALCNNEMNEQWMRPMHLSRSIVCANTRALTPPINIYHSGRQLPIIWQSRFVVARALPFDFLCSGSYNL